MKLRATLLLAAMLIPAAAAPAPAPPDAGWRYYINSLYAFTFYYPSRLLIAQGEALNSDGQTFLSRDHTVKVLAYGRYAQPPESGKSGFEQELGMTLDAARDEHMTLGYKLVKPHLFVLSGTTPAGVVWYNRTEQVDDRLITLEFRYPQAQRPLWDPLVVKITKQSGVGHPAD